MCIADDNGMFYKINNDKSRTYFNVLLTDKHLTKWDKKKDNTGYIKINKYDVYCSATDLHNQLFRDISFILYYIFICLFKVINFTICNRILYFMYIISPINWYNTYQWHYIYII